MERVLAGRTRTLEDLASAERAADAAVDTQDWTLLTRWWEVERPIRWSRHRHREHELVWDVTGLVAVSASDRLWLVPPGAGLWIPSGADHEVIAATGTRFACTFVAPSQCPQSWSSPRVVSVNPLTAEAFRQFGVVTVSERMRARIAEVAIGLLAPYDELPALPLPQDPRARVVTDGLLADPADGRSLEAWARAAHVSIRTLSRLFADEAGMSFVQWRTLLRHTQATSLLADGLTVSEVGRRVGYQTASAFSAAFRRTVGQPPGRFTAGSGARRSSGVARRPEAVRREPRHENS